MYKPCTIYSNQFFHALFYTSTLYNHLSFNTSCMLLFVDVCVPIFTWPHLSLSVLLFHNSTTLLKFWRFQCLWIFRKRLSSLWPFILCTPAQLTSKQPYIHYIPSYFLIGFSHTCTHAVKAALRGLHWLNDRKWMHLTCTVLHFPSWPTFVRLAPLSTNRMM